MTHAQYKTRLCTCEHALSRTPTRGDTRNAYARSQPASQPTSQPGISPSPSSRFSFSSSSSSSSFDARRSGITVEVTESGTERFSGIRIGRNATLSYRSLSISRPPLRPLRPEIRRKPPASSPRAQSRYAHHFLRASVCVFRVATTLSRP